MRLSAGEPRCRAACGPLKHVRSLARRKLPRRAFGAESDAATSLLILFACRFERRDAVVVEDTRPIEVCFSQGRGRTGGAGWRRGGGGARERVLGWSISAYAPHTFVPARVFPSTSNR